LWSAGDGGDGNGAGVRGQFGDGGEVAEVEVVVDLFDERWAGGKVGGLGAGDASEVGGGDLESVEEAVGTPEVEVAGGDAAEYLEEGDLDGGALIDAGHGEEAGAAADGHGRAGGSMVVAEVKSAERGRGAAMAIGEDMAAEVAAAGIDDLRRELRLALHGYPLPGYLKS
jgi:hypothetical protein